MHRSLTLAFSTALLLNLPLTQAATVSVEAWAIASTSAGPGGTNTSCAAGTRAGYDCQFSSGRVGSNRDPLGYATSAQTHFEFSSNNLPATEPPNFVYDSAASASASLGSLHAAVNVQLQGHGETSGATNRAPTGVSGRARARIIDDITVESATLARGTPVTLQALLDVSGNGAGSLELDVLSFFGATQEQNLRLIDAASFGGSLDDISTSFTVRVGSLVRVTYVLEALTGQFIVGWRPIDILNGRANSSDYGNSAHLYLRPTAATPDVRLNNGTNFSYAFPVTVPLPGGMALMMGALPLLAWRMQRARRATVD